MYLTASTITVSMLLRGFSQMADEGTDSQSLHQYNVLCRWVDADDSVVVGPTLALIEGEKAKLRLVRRSPVCDRRFNSAGRCEKAANRPDR